jgi:hypothetical protein
MVKANWCYEQERADPNYVCKQWVELTQLKVEEALGLNWRVINMKYYAKQDILIVESYIKAGDEILLLKKGEEREQT